MRCRRAKITRYMCWLPLLVIVGIAVPVLLFRAKSKRDGQEAIGTFKSNYVESGYTSPKDLDSPANQSTSEIDEVVEFEEMKRDTKRASDKMLAPKIHESMFPQLFSHAHVPDSSNSATVNSPGSPSGNASDAPVDGTLTETATDNVDAAANEADDDEGPPPAVPVKNHGDSRTSETNAAPVDDSVAEPTTDNVDTDDDEGPPPPVPVKHH